MLRLHNELAQEMLNWKSGLCLGHLLRGWFACWLSPVAPKAKQLFEPSRNSQIHQFTKKFTSLYTESIRISVMTNCCGSSERWDA
jgi:hypothetical protein